MDDPTNSLSSLELRNQSLMQWFTLPMHKGRLARLQSLVKLFLGSFFFGDRNVDQDRSCELPILAARASPLPSDEGGREFSQILSRIQQER